MVMEWIEKHFVAVECVLPEKVILMRRKVA
jgi:hypothetical protein